MHIFKMAEYQPFVFLINVDIILDIVIMTAQCNDNQNLRVSVDWRLTILILIRNLLTM